MIDCHIQRGEPAGRGGGGERAGAEQHRQGVPRAAVGGCVHWRAAAVVDGLKLRATANEKARHLLAAAVGRHIACVGGEMKRRVKHPGARVDGSACGDEDACRGRLPLARREVKRCVTTCGHRVHGRALPEQ